MKILSVWAALAVVFSGPLLACGDADEPTPAGAPEDVWSTVTDPLNGKAFRCFTAYRESGYGGGPAMFCYELDTEVYGGD